MLIRLLRSITCLARRARTLHEQRYVRLKQVDYNKWAERWQWLQWLQWLLWLLSLQCQPDTDPPQD